MISRSFEFTVIMDRGSVASIKLTNRDDSLDISPTEYRFITDLESDGLVEVRRFRDYIELVTLDKSLFDAVEANFEVPETVNDGELSQKQPGYTRRVFVVHGHDEEIKQHTARTLEKLDFEPIILHEQPSQGMTIIEKLEKYSDVGFAVVLLTPDDKAESVRSSSGEVKYRARQNVVMELGYFLGKLGRDRVLALYRKRDDFELPSDYDGVIYEVYDRAGNWRYSLAKELRAAGYEVDMNVL
ncbi:MAG: nucleotide-binding protein [Anaerolineae bacterium]|nr:nucleotide-binding protein [Anaerolineae bacterium]